MKHSRDTKSTLLRVLLYVFVILVVLITLYPYFVMFTTAAKSRAEIYATKGTLLPIHWLWQNFKDIWTLAPLSRYFINSLIVAGGSYLLGGFDRLFCTLTEDGSGLSQGQKQLLCIARIMLTDPPFLILDEATSSIDLRTEQRIQKAFEKLMAGKTSFIIAHRLSTIKSADWILVMNQGNVLEQGTHDSLMAQKGFYANLYQSQFADSETTE